MYSSVVGLLALLGIANAHGGHDQTPLAGPHQRLWYNTLPGDGGTQALLSTLVPHTDPELGSDLVASGKDLAVSIFKSWIAETSLLRRMAPTLRENWQGSNPNSYDNAWAIQQIEEGHNSVLMRKPFTDAEKYGLSKAGKTLPRIITLGGDHTITLPLLRSINRAYGPVTSEEPMLTVSRDSWKPKVFGGSPSQVAAINHGTYFYHAAMEGLLKNDTNIHAGIRTTLSGPSDYENDGYCGFEIVEAREIDTIGTDGIIKKIRERVGTENPVYLSIDIDTLDPAYLDAPATGTPETGGWSTRELRTIIRGLDGLNFIGADIVEVAPAYDTNAELSTMAAADVLYEILTIMVKKGPLSVGRSDEL
ncbi:agmatinase [Aspergillus luchuensis]|uniref:Agmatinase n=1 Tax=Aspergillus kawachii TaxID=1069201 RepID=A0A146EZM1_ASPKA|nr:agmatinase [Aspergillus luchuensis]